MKVVNIDILTDQEAIVIFKGVKYELKEPTLKDWGKFLKITEIKDYNLKTVEILNVCKLLIPDIFKEVDGVKPIDEFTQTEFLTLYKIIIKVFEGGIGELGKKTKPLYRIIKTI